MPNPENLTSEKSSKMSPKQAGGAFADGLTFIRLLITPVIMAIIIATWPDIKMAVFASILFLIAALTDVLDDYFGGASRAGYRKYGWIDDIADTVLTLGVLLALSIVIVREGIMTWTFAVPVLILFLRELTVALLKGRELRQFGWPDNKLSNAKVGLSILAVCTLVAAPWLSQFTDVFRAENDPSRLLNLGSPWVWFFGELFLWLAAILSVASAIRIFRTKFTANDA